MAGQKVDHTNTKCCVCGSSETYIMSNGGTDWRRYKEKGRIWDGKSYSCKKCYGKEYQSRPDSQNNIKKSIANARTGNINKDDNKGRGFIGEAVISKVRKLEILSILLDNFRAKFDLSLDTEYGIIQSKFRLFNNKQQRWIIDFGIDHNFDILFCLCISNDTRNIERIYAIPKGKIYDRKIIYISKNSFVWEEFRIDEKPYNDAYHSLMEFLKDKKYFGIEDIKKWLEKED